MATCKLCERKPPAPNGICESCMDTLGIVEMPPPRRRPGPCIKCQGLKFIRVIPREHTIRAGRELNVAEIAPMTLTQEPKVSGRLIGSGKAVSPPTIVRGDGMLETYTCYACGYVEWYVEEPSEIQIGPEYMSELIDDTPDAPYR